MAENLNTDGLGLAISDRMTVATVDRSERCVQLYGVENTCGIMWTNRKLTVGLVRPYDVAFAPNNNLVVTDNGDNTIKIYNLEDLRLVSEIKHNYIISPQNVVVGPGPLSQLFVVCGNEVVIFNMDWNKVLVTSELKISSPTHWHSVQFNTLMICDNLSMVKDHNQNHKVGGRNPLAVNTAQFCAMFYHVTERSKTRYSCLESSECRIGKEGNKRGFAATVVVYVRLTDGRGRLIFHARYGNCYEGPEGNTIHAEYFMLMDGEFREAVNSLSHSQNGGNINIYMNKQPCYCSTGNDRTNFLKIKECALDLVKFYCDQCSPRGIKLTILLCQLYKVDMRPSKASTTLAKEIQNARQGMKMMMSAGIEFKSMTEESWQQLAEHADVKLPEYQRSSRQKLDQHVAEVLVNLKAQKSCSSDNVPTVIKSSRTGSRVKEQVIERSASTGKDNKEHNIEADIHVPTTVAANDAKRTPSVTSAEPFNSTESKQNCRDVERAVRRTKGLESDSKAEEKKNACAQSKPAMKSTCKKSSVSHQTASKQEGNALLVPPLCKPATAPTRAPTRDCLELATKKEVKAASRSETIQQQESQPTKPRVLSENQASSKSSTSISKDNQMASKQANKTSLAPSLGKPAMATATTQVSTKFSGCRFQAGKSDKTKVEKRSKTVSPPQKQKVARKTKAKAAPPSETIQQQEFQSTNPRVLSKKTASPESSPCTGVKNQTALKQANKVSSTGSPGKGATALKASSTQKFRKELRKNKQSTKPSVLSTKSASS